MADPFDSAWLKWAWAVAEAKALHDDIDAFSEQIEADGFGTTRCDYQPQHHRFAVVIDSVMTELPPRWGLRLGNIVHNYRSCLDHIAWDVVCRGHRPPTTLTESQQRAVGFPISLKREDFNAALDVISAPKGRPKLPGVRRTDIARIHRYQPYHRRKGTHALTLLDRLCRFDKHREIQPVAGFVFGGKLDITKHRDCVPGRTSRRNNPGSKLEIGAKFAYVSVRETGPNPEMSVKAALSVKPIIDEGFWLNEWLAKAEWQVSVVLRQFSEPPQKLLEGLKAPA
jgi:hypothetical protein